MGSTGQGRPFRRFKKRAAWTAAGACLTTLCLGPRTSHASILPKNNLHLQDNLYLSADISEQDFEKIISDIVTRYKPVVASHGAELVIRNRWTDPTVNASAQQNGNTWVLNMYGGLARRPELTPDAFALVVCHELGHHLGGFSFYGNDNSEWAASEGQADYFATQSCAREIWKNKKEENAEFRARVGEFEKSKCDSIWSNTADQDLCYRITTAGQSLATLLSALRSGGAPQFSTPDAHTVTKTYTGHPEAQCRLDTYLAGALCSVPFLKDFIPGRNHSLGQDSPAAEELASATSCTAAAGFTLGNRPRCWFKPKVDYLGLTYGQSLKGELAGSGNGNAVIEPGEVLSLQFTLGNLARKSTTQVVGTLQTDSPNVEILQNTVTFPDISPGTREAQREPFLVRIGQNALCGSQVNLTLNARSSEGDRSFTESITIGKIIHSLKGSNKKSQDIPDNSSEGIKSVISVAEQKPIRGVTVALDISHTYSGDLSIDLISPSGIAKNLVQRNGGSADGVNRTIDLDWSTQDTAGDWTLHVKDLAGSDVGKLNSWSLTFSEAFCQGVSETLRTASAIKHR